MEANTWYCHCGLKDNADIQAIRRVHASVWSREFRGCFAANPALSLVKMSRIRVGVNHHTYLHHKLHTQKKC
jgi:hypothetical protein